MANSSTGSGNLVYGSFDTVDGVSNTVRVRGSKLVDIAVKAIAGDSIALQGEYRVGTSNAYSWETIKSYTTATYEVLRFAAPRNLRLYFTTDGGGTTYYSMEVGNKE